MELNKTKNTEKSLTEKVKEVFVKPKTILEKLQEERKELQDKQERLSKFLKSKKTDKLEKDQIALMKKQSLLMTQYIEVLNNRIKIL